MEEITIALKNIKEIGSFCGKRAIPSTKLQLAIKPFGDLNFPLSPLVIKKLIKLAKPAKFGWRDQTLLDPTVRNAWEIAKNHIKTGADWNKELAATVELLKKDLGLPETAKLQANLHNLLIYEPGQFFNYHQDSEKLDGMVATLIIILPSSHKGGILVIDHKGTKKQFHSSRFPIDQLTLIAFYADCHHEVKVLKEGYRLALTYNLTMLNHSNKIDIPNEQNDYESVIKSLSNYFIEDPQTRSIKRYVYLLDHSYTQKGLSWDHLKDGDILRAKALKVASDRLDLEIYMALADIQETWDCEEDYDYYGYRRHKRKYSDYEEDDDGYEEPDPDNIQVNELIDSSTILKHWIDQKNQPLNYKDWQVSSDYIGWTKASDQFQPFQSEHEGYMGNYGNTVDRWYHRAAIIVWRKQDHYPILFTMDPNSVVNELLMLTKKSTNNAMENKSKVCNIISTLLPYWSEYIPRFNDSESCLNVINLAVYVNDPKLAKAMIIDFNMGILNTESATLLLALQDLYGISWCIDILKKWSILKESCNIILKNFSKIVKILSKHKELTEWLLRSQFNWITKNHLYCKKNYNRINLLEGVATRMSEIMDFIKACMIVNDTTVYAELLNHIMVNIELYPVIELVSIIEVLKNHAQNLEKWDYQKLFNYVLSILEHEKQLGLRKIDDWSINEQVPCKCQDCGTLSDFLRSCLITMKWPLGKERRQHIHRIIDGLGIPVLHQTERTGSPHKLILTKIEQLYKKAKQQFDKLNKTLSHFALF